MDDEGDGRHSGPRNASQFCETCMLKPASVIAAPQNRGHQLLSRSYSVRSIVRDPVLADAAWGRSNLENDAVI